jgi:hypothetical protein
VSAWVYRVTVPSDKTDAFVDAMQTLGLTDEDALEVLTEGDS